MAELILVDPDLIGRCFYKLTPVVTKGDQWVCMIHDKTSKYEIKAGSQLPCRALALDERISDAQRHRSI